MTGLIRGRGIKEIILKLLSSAMVLFYLYFNSKRKWCHQVDFPRRPFLASGEIALLLFHRSSGGPENDEGVGGLNQI